MARRRLGWFAVGRWREREGLRVGVEAMEEEGEGEDNVGEGGA